jgi:elongation factor G
MDPMIRRIRNIGILAHIDAGKTTLTERILMATGRIRIPGEVDDGTATMDFMVQERERGITIGAAATRVGWRDHVIHLIDTPGHVDFTIEVERSLRVLDGAIVVLSASEGVQPQTEHVWAQADARGVPRLVFINKLDRVGADFDRCLADLQTRLNAPAVAFQLPVVEDGRLTGVLDLVHSTLLTFTRRDRGVIVQSEPVPESLEVELAFGREALLNAALHSDAVMERYLTTGSVSPADLYADARQRVLEGTLVPVFCGAAKHHQGVQPLLDAVIELLPSPADVGPCYGLSAMGRGTSERRRPDVSERACALVFKLVHDRDEGLLAFTRVYSGALRVGDVVLNPRTGAQETITQLFAAHAEELEPVSVAEAGAITVVAGLTNPITGDTLCDPGAPLLLEPLTPPTPVLGVVIEAETVESEERLNAALQRPLLEDPTLRLTVDPQTGQRVLEGMGELHLEIAVERLRREHGLALRVGQPRVTYLLAPSVGAVGEGTHRLVTSAGEQRATLEVRLTLQPDVPVVSIEPGWAAIALPEDYAEAIVSALRAGVERALGGGAPLAFARVSVSGGSCEPGPGALIAARVAAGLALDDALKRSSIMVMEPIMRLEVRTPGDYMGGVLGDLQARRGIVTSTTPRPPLQVIEADVPLAELVGYTTALRSATQGRSSASIQFSRHSPAPPKLSRLIFEPLVGDRVKSEP